MKFNQASADLFIPDGAGPDSAHDRVTHLGIGAHSDDLEFMALHGIIECYQKSDKWFGGITCTNGSGSPRSGDYAGLSDAELVELRLQEQRDAAVIGQYALMAQLGYSSSQVKDATQRAPVVDDIVAVLRATQPETVYTHNPFDKHPTHVAVFLAAIEAIRRLPTELRPARVFGCEVWRGLDWLPDKFKLRHDVSAHPQLSGELAACFKSQVSGGKRYDLAVQGRYLANATFDDAHAVDAATRVSYAIDLTCLTRSDGPSVQEFVHAVLSEFSDTINEGL